MHAPTRSSPPLVTPTTNTPVQYLTTPIQGKNTIYIIKAPSNMHAAALLHSMAQSAPLSLSRRVLVAPRQQRPAGNTPPQNGDAAVFAHTHTRAHVLHTMHTITHATLCSTDGWLGGILWPNTSPLTATCMLTQQGVTPQRGLQSAYAHTIAGAGASKKTRSSPKTTHHDHQPQLHTHATQSRKTLEHTVIHASSSQSNKAGKAWIQATDSRVVHCAVPSLGCSLIHTSKHQQASSYISFYILMKIAPNKGHNHIT